MSAQDFLARRNVSRETLERLSFYKALLDKWNPAINLVSAATLGQVWTRHFLDSAQILDLTRINSGHWADLGSGGGFPGLVLAILAADERPDLKFTLVESDGRKAAFLTTVARELGIVPRVAAERIENLPALRADVLSARALAPMNVLLGFADRHLSPGGLAIFPKGAKYQVEIDQALEEWRFSYEKRPSVTDPDAVILTVGEIAHV
ncbi:16S rRNA (guanine(527)-N(7))-methyltransferase RsmG [Albidovulum sediminicola]|uniref:Ribosomal RNA small subunit methyltransferase G n=1 Tax=Albidovulum sediminicola TaxID=2984331 RepID=A0ABT2YWP1_9RHOB|nr:16S rRNA (guanine(527)-N(7))-methyltransferase RsmG [Defluviimonas sp. WL0075]MCV2863282.1 16S rRNA (guanine(527)-N(7))-methyltransferase RsmG [Defluviimonas sp. WL0075]